jgi:hypothetical protein
MPVADRETRKFWAGNNTPGKKGFQPKSVGNPSGDASGGGITAERDKGSWEGLHVGAGGGEATDVQLAGAVGRGRVSFSHPAPNSAVATITHGTGGNRDTFTFRGGQGKKWTDPGGDPAGTKLSAALDKSYGKSLSSLPALDRAIYGDKQAERRWASRGGPPPVYD